MANIILLQKSTHFLSLDCNIQQLCRLCLNELKDFKTELYRHSPNLVSELRETGCTDVIEDDELPKYICRLCLDTILKHAAFRKICRESEGALQDWLVRKNGAGLKVENSEGDSDTETFQWEINSNNGENVETEKADENSLSNGQENLGKGKKMLPCSDCGAVLNSHSALAYHRLVHSGLRRHACHHCHKKFILKASLVKHLRVHTGDKPYTCDKCGKSFTQQSNLKSHMTSHTHEKIFCCDVCGKVFTLAHNLKDHLKIHSVLRERPFGCDWCDKAFYHRSHLRNHLMAHANTKPYACDTCGKAFIKRSYLKQHNRVHTGERPYGCRLCSRAFSNSSNLSAHLKGHAGAARHLCPSCSEGFPTRQKLAFHISSSHKDDPP